MFNERVLGADGTAPDYDLSRPADQLFTDPGYVWKPGTRCSNAKHRTAQQDREDGRAASADARMTRRSEPRDLDVSGCRGLRGRRAAPDHWIGIAGRLHRCA